MKKGEGQSIGMDKPKEVREGPMWLFGRRLFQAKEKAWHVQRRAKSQGVWRKKEQGGWGGEGLGEARQGLVGHFNGFHFPLMINSLTRFLGWFMLLILCLSLSLSTFEAGLWQRVDHIPMSE